MHMHCVFFNLVGAKSRRVPLLVPTSSLSLLQWPLLCKHVAEIQLPRAKEQNWADNTAQKAEHHLGNNHGVLNYSSANKCIKTLRAIWQSQRERETIYMMVHWCHGESKTEQWLISEILPSPHWHLQVFQANPKVLIVFSFLILLKMYWEGIILYSPLYMQKYKCVFVIWPTAWKKENPQQP